MEITPHRLKQIIITSSEIGARYVIDTLGLDKKQISLAEAYRVYGRKRVDYWKREGLVDYAKQGKRIFINKSDCEKQASINRLMDQCFE